MQILKRYRVILSQSLVVCSCFCLVIWTLQHQQIISMPQWVVIYSLVGFMLLVERFRIEQPSGEDFSIETSYLIGFSFVYPSNLIIWSALAYGLISSIRYKRHWDVQVVNGIGLALCTLISKYVVALLPSQYASLDANNIIGLLVFVCVYFVTNYTLFPTYVWIRYGYQRCLHFYKTITKTLLVVYAVTVIIGVILSLVIRNGGTNATVLFTGLLLLVSYTYRDYFRATNHFKELAVKDELTGLHNHRYIQSYMDEMINKKRPFALLMLDIDKFKRYNEQLGHVQGDEALKILADTLSSMRMQDEEIARYSGEEFVIALPEYGKDQAMLKAELVRKAIEDTRFPGEDEKKRITVSVGVALYPDMADNKRDLLMTVDDALYKGKLTGRNRINIYSSVLDELKEDLQTTDEDQEIVKTIKVFLAILNSKDRYTLAHTERDVLYADGLAARIGLSQERRRLLRFGSFLHDIGKVEVPLEVLTKRGPLTREEWMVMKSHVEIGEKIARPIPGLAPCLPIIRHHHERYDGKGYPDGLAGHDIPLEARILTIADSFDAMTTSRPYQKKRTMESAFNELRACASAQFDPDLVEPFIEVVKEIGLLSTEEETEELA